MANTATLITNSATPYHITYALVGDGTVAGPTIANATILADMATGPLKTAWSAAYASQSAMRAGLLAGVATGCRARLLLLASGVDVTAQNNQITIDVDVDAVTPTKAEINVTMSDTTGQIAYLVLECCNSITE